ncbi:MAG: hypothetical protein HYU84_18340 [Chloroflexi bacterium]|nr:hypothetical protein [Chloroflexota bacterium]MBI3168684.1 hypothetical protein [Chloroflexota bacterium]
MSEIVALLQSIAPVISTTALPQLHYVVYGMLISSGRITMLELSCLIEKAGGVAHKKARQSFPAGSIL